MTMPLPPTNPHSLAPTRLADHNARLKQKEGVILPTPRTYRKTVSGSVASVAGTALRMTTMDIVIQPGEILGLMMSCSAQCATASTSFASYLTSGSSPFGAYSTDLIYSPPIPAHATNRFSYVSGGSSSTLGFPTAGVFPGQFTWLMPYRDSTAQLNLGPTAPVTVTLDFYARRTAGSGTINLYDAFFWAMLL